VTRSSQTPVSIDGGSAERGRETIFLQVMGKEFQNRLTRPAGPQISFINPNTWLSTHPLLDQTPSKAEIQDGRSKTRTPTKQVRRGAK
jgi:hypothetical protein